MQLGVAVQETDNVEPPALNEDVENNATVPAGADDDDAGPGFLVRRIRTHRGEFSFRPFQPLAA